jgi:hypothetical protein
MNLNVNLTPAQLATILGALRVYQDRGYGDSSVRPNDIHDIVTNGDSLDDPLDDDGIDALCERLNTCPALDLEAAKENLDGVLRACWVTDMDPEDFLDEFDATLMDLDELEEMPRDDLFYSMGVLHGVASARGVRVVELFREIRDVPADEDGVDA